MRCQTTLARATALGVILDASATGSIGPQPRGAAANKAPPSGFRICSIALGGL
jgi:hypothetical protein